MATGANRRTLDQLLEAASARITRYEPTEALAALECGGLLIDIRSDLDRALAGIVPGSLHIPRSVLEWRLEPTSGVGNPHVRDLGQEVILMCDHGCSSILAAATLVDLGFARAGDVIGGFDAWARAGLATAPCPRSQRRKGEPPGLGGPDR